MNKNVRVAAIAGSILAAELCSAYVAFHEARTIETTRISVAKKRAALNSEIFGLEERIAANDLDHAQLKESQSRMAAETAGPPQAASSGLDQPIVFATSPKAMAFRMVAYRATIRRAFKALYQALGLAPPQIDAFENLMVGYHEEMYDLRRVALRTGLDPSDPTIAALAHQEHDRLGAAQIALLGDAGFKQLRQFERIQPVQSVVDKVDSYTGYPPTPLTSAQQQQLAAVLANASSSYQSGGPANPLTIDWNRAFDQAQSILSEAQLEALRLASYKCELERLRRQFFQANYGAK